MIKLKNVNKYYQSGNDKIHVIRDLNYEFPNTGLIFILGPSGSGKSTLLNLLGGLDKADSGEIWIEDREISTFTKKEHNYYLNSYLGFVFQEYNILKDLNLKENISLSLEIQGISKKEQKKRVNQIIKEVELEGLEKRKVNQLSGGQKQRIAIARALVKDPKLIIADEPTGNLDSNTSKKIFELFKKMSKKRLIIIVTHDEESATIYGDDILRFDTANVDENASQNINLISSSINQNKEEIFDRNLVLKKTKTPYKTIFKLAFKNMWIKKFRYLLIFIISIISLVFLSFAIELNGDKLYQNVYTTINNNVTYTNIFQYNSNSTEKTDNFYDKYQMGELMNGAYNKIKEFTPDITMHKYQSVSINYAKYNIEKANFLYKGTLDTIIYYDPSNSYNLLAGQLPNPEAPEILITDYLLDAFKYFGIIDINTNIYNIINKHIDLGYNVTFKVVGVIGTNYNKWHHLTRLPKSYVLDTYDKTMKGFSYDFLVMNSVIVGSKYYNYILTDSFQNAQITVNNFQLQESALIAYENQEIVYGRAPEASNEIMIPFTNVEKIIGFTYPYWARDYWDKIWYLDNYVFTSGTTYDARVSTSCNSIETETGKFEVSANGTFKIVGMTSSRDFILSKKGFDSYNEAVETSKSSSDQEKILIELPKNPSKALSQFNKLYNNDYKFIINVFDFKDTIESYNVDPMIEFASTGGLIVFAILAIGIMWTIISLEIVDSKKEIGIMRSIGLNGTKVSLIFIIQALLVNILAYIASIPLANEVINWYGTGIKDALNEITLSLYTLTYRSPVILFVFIVSITLISAFVPLIRIMSKKIINVINERDE